METHKIHGELLGRQLFGIQSLQALSYFPKGYTTFGNLLSLKVVPFWVVLPEFLAHF